MTNEAIDLALYVATVLLVALGIGLALSLWWA
jgi:hypothetical protein